MQLRPRPQTPSLKSAPIRTYVMLTALYTAVLRLRSWIIYPVRLVCCSVEEVDRLWVCEPDIDGDVFEADSDWEGGKGGRGDWAGREDDGECERGD